MTFTRVLTVTGLAAVAITAPLHGQQPMLTTVLERAGVYAGTFQQQLSNLVAEERYVQDIRYVNLPPGRLQPSHRELRSDILLVKPNGGDGYVEFRDVFQVDGAAVRDRQERLTTLFLDPGASADAQIRRINQDSARYNLGNIERTINTPTLPLFFLLPEHQSRFRFERTTKAAATLAREGVNARGASSFTAPSDAWVVEFEEIRRPTLIRTTRGLDLPARGRLWIDSETGRVLMTELVTDDMIVRATIDVVYKPDTNGGLMVPSEMRERYEGRRDGAVIEGDASYGNIRRFQVRSNEQFGADVPVTPAVAADVIPSPSVEHPAAAAEPKPAADVTPAAATEPKPTADVTPAAVAPVQITRPPAPQPTAQTFIARTERVVVDFVVTDKSDRPVRGLSAKDVVVKEDGKEQPIVSFEAFARGGVFSRVTPRETPAETAPAQASSPNAATVLLVDDGQLSPAQAARLRPAVKALLAKVAGPNGVLMLVAPGSGVSVAGVLPGNAAAIAAAADQITGHRIDEQTTFPMSDAEALDIARGELTALARVVNRFATLNPELTPQQANDFARELANKVAHDARSRRNAMYDAALLCLDWLGKRPGRHSLLVVSAGFSQDPDDAKSFEVVTRSLRTNAPIHFLDARGLQGISSYNGAETGSMLARNADGGPFGWWDSAQGSMALADATGGLSISNSNDIERGLTRVLDTMTTYYVLAYEPPPHAKAGFRRIQIETHSKGLRVRARSGYLSGPATR